MVLGEGAGDPIRWCLIRAGDPHGCREQQQTGIALFHFDLWQDLLRYGLKVAENVSSQQEAFLLSTTPSVSLGLQREFL